MQIQKAQSLGLLSSINQSTGKLGKVLEKLSTAKRINQASDDAAGLSIAEQLTTQVRGYQSANLNLSYAQSAQSIAEGTGNQTTAMLQRQRELAIQASNGTLTDNDRAALNQEYQALNQELTRIADSAQFNTQNVANGQNLAAGNGTVLAGPNPGSELGIAGADFTAAGLGTAGTDILNPSNAAAALSAVDTAISGTSEQRTAIGANMNRMEYASNNNTRSAALTQEAESRIRDLDYAQGVMDATREQLLNQTGMAALKNFNEVSRNNLMQLLS